MAERIELSGLNGIRNNLNVQFNMAIETIVERVVETPEHENVSSETIAELIQNAIKTFDSDLKTLCSYVEHCRKYSKDHPKAE